MSDQNTLFSVVDIEATGSDPANDRIIECAVVISDGKKVVDTYCTLIDPETQIPPFIVGMTGISDEMVMGAPTMNQVAHQINGLIEGKVFVAHNVTFDYNFLKIELAQCGIDISLPTICSCKTARKILRGHSSYSLQNLTSALQIEHTNAHRALDDALAATELFHVLYEQTEGDLNRFRSDHVDIPLSCPIPAEHIKDLPNSPGLVWFKDAQGQPLHVAKARNIKQRTIQKLSKFNSKRFRDIYSGIESLEFEVTGNYTMARIREIDFIIKFNPPFNRRISRHTLKVDQRFVNKAKPVVIDAYGTESIRLIKDKGPTTAQDTLFLLKENQIMGYLTLDREEVITRFDQLEDRFIMLPDAN